MRPALVVCTLALWSGGPSRSTAYADGWDEGGFSPPQPFMMLDAAIGGVTPGRATSAASTGSRIATIGDGALVIDEDSGQLVRADATGAVVAQLDIAAGAGLLAYDPVAKLAYVADRRGDRIVVVGVGDRSLIVRTAWRTPAEPYGVALAPDRSALLVTTIAERTLVAYAPKTGAELWRTALDPEPRGVAIAADGRHAAVTSLTSGGIAIVDLAARGHRAVRRALPHGDAGFAKAAFAATYLGDSLVATALQEHRPHPGQFEDVSDHYGGSSTPPVSFTLAFVGSDGATAHASTNLNEPRALAWDPARDLLYAVGMAKGQVVQIRRASQVDPEVALLGMLPTSCGADGLAIAADGNVRVWCSFSRSVARLDVMTPKLEAMQVTAGPSLAPSKLDDLAHEGMQLFHTSTEHVSEFAQLSCGNCHLDGRADGLSWLIHDAALQTPMLAGRLVGTAPFKWDGTAKTLTASVRSTVGRLGGSGLGKHDVAALVAYLEAMPAVRTPPREPAAVARGKALFESAELGCASCHDGSMLTDQQRHAFETTKQLDTPSLVGLAASAPYFHDGSAPTLDALLRDHGHVHGMASDATTRLPATQLADLRAFLETL